MAVCARGSAIKLVTNGQLKPGVIYFLDGMIILFGVSLRKIQMFSLVLGNILPSKKAVYKGVVSVTCPR